MIAADTSTWIAFLEGAAGDDVEILALALKDQQVLMVPAVLAELLSDPELPAAAARLLAGVPGIDTETGYWERAGVLRTKVLRKGRKARLGDALIAQSCIDRGVRLITRDRDFRAFAHTAGLDVLISSS